MIDNGTSRREECRGIRNSEQITSRGTQLCRQLLNTPCHSTEGFLKPLSRDLRGVFPNSEERGVLYSPPARRFASTVSVNSANSLTGTVWPSISSSFDSRKPIPEYSISPSCDCRSSCSSRYSSPTPCRRELGRLLTKHAGTAY